MATDYRITAAEDRAEIFAHAGQDLWETWGYSKHTRGNDGVRTHPASDLPA